MEDIHERGIDIDNRRIYLHGSEPIDNEEPGVDYRMMNQFVKNLDALACTEGDIHVIMGTLGGDWNYGMGIYDAIKACPRRVIITAYAWARSMSSIILQAGAERVLMPHCDFMVHYGTSAYDGHYLAVQSGVSFERRTEETMLRLYAERCVGGKCFRGWSVEEVMRFIEARMKERSDWWMSAKEAVDYGFADRVAG